MTLPVCRAAELEARPEARRWLVEELWADEAVGIVGGEPKCGKSFLALDLAVAVASGAPALRRFPVPRPGPVVLFAAEDALHIVRARLCDIAHAVGVDFDRLDVHVITRPVLRLDLDVDRALLRDITGQIEPRLVVLDPFVRLHRIDENVAGEVAPLLAFLRPLQRRFQTAVLLVHHARKGGPGQRAGQALRGSSELHAWGDSNLYLHRTPDAITLTIEHRAAPGQGPIALELCGGAGLSVRTTPAPPSNPHPNDPAHRVRDALASVARPLTRSELRDVCQMRTQTLGQVLTRMVDRGDLVRHGDRYALA